MPGHVKVSGTWKELNGLHVKVSGTWKAVKSGYIKVSGVWKEFYASLSVVFNPTSYTFQVVDSSPVSCGIIFRNDGTIDRDLDGVISQQGTWHVDAPQAGLGDDFEITAASGGLGTWTAAAAADDTPAAMTSDREWSVTRVGTGTKTANRTFTINEVGNPSNAGSALGECEAEAL